MPLNAKQQPGHKLIIDLLDVHLMRLSGFWATPVIHLFDILKQLKLQFIKPLYEML